VDIVRNRMVWMPDTPAVRMECFSDEIVSISLKLVENRPEECQGRNWNTIDTGRQAGTDKVARSSVDWRNQEH
jgi:hypothetical protein